MADDGLLNWLLELPSIDSLDSDYLLSPVLEPPGG